MKSFLGTLALGAILVLAAARPASAESLFSDPTWAHINGCTSSTAYALDELHACERAMDDLDAQSKVTTNQVDLQNVDLMLANIGVIEGLLCEQLGIDGTQNTFTSIRSLLETIRSRAVSADIAQRASSMLALMDKDGI